MVALLEAAGIRFTRPDANKYDPTTLDFHLTDFGLYIEVKQFHTDRIARQLSQAPSQTTVIVLQGPRAVEDFARLCSALAQPGK